MEYANIWGRKRGGKREFLIIRIKLREKDKDNRHGMPEIKTTGYKKGKAI